MYYLEKRTRRILEMCQILLIDIISVTLALLVDVAFINSVNNSDIVTESIVETRAITEEEPVVEKMEKSQPVDIYVEDMVKPVVEIIEEIIEEPEEVVVVEVVEPTYYDVPLDEDLQDHIFSECESYDIDPTLVISIINKESGFRESAKGDNGKSYGLMQIQKKWHVDRMEKLSVTDLLNPYQNVTVGIDYLTELLDREKGVEWALMAYNGGPSYANKLEAKGIVSKYAKTVLAYSKELKGV